MNISSVIEKTVDAIHAGETRKKTLTSRIMHLKKKSFPSFADGSLSVPVKRFTPNCKIAGVDSGFVSKRMSSVDLILVRAVGVVFHYSDGKVVNSNYYPGFFSFPEPHLTAGSLEEPEVEQSKSLLRLREELGAAKALIEEHNPKYLFIDGSIVPQYQDKPNKESALSGNYSDIITEFESLYAAAEKHDCTLISTVEDSRGSRFRQILQEEILPKEMPGAAREFEGLLDSSILDYFLDIGERCCAFSYTKDIRQHPVLQDFNSKWASSIYGFYLKPATLDRPLRVEFICHGGLKEKADEIASVVYALSSMHREYAYPSILIEADLRAKLRPDEIEIVYNKIMDKLGASVKLRMRRENRPF